MTTLQQLMMILLYVWIGLTAMMIVTWVLRRRSVKSERAANPNAVKLNLQQTGDETETQPVALHPALIGADDADAGADADVDAGESDTTRSDTSSDTGSFFATTTTDTIDVDTEMLDTETLDTDTLDTETVEIETVEIETVDTETLDTETVEIETVEIADRDDHEDDLSRDPADALAEGGNHMLETAVLPTLQPQTLIDLLDGIKLPYDLTPVTAAVEDPDCHLIFLTTHSNAEEVGTQFADELVSIGYEFEPVGLDQAIASRGSDTISMTIVPEASEVQDANGRRYGAAGRGDVALELWIGDSPSPPSATD